MVDALLAGIPRTEILQRGAVDRLNAHLDIDPVDARVEAAPGFYDEPVFGGPDLKCVSSI